VTLARGGDRRALGLANPGLGGFPYATATLWAAVQWLNGKEVAPAHRHSAQAVRFMIDGKGAYSTVQGDKVYLERGDFAINPPWYWHDHGSEGDGPAVWMDGLDVPLNNYLDAVFFEPGARDTQEITQVVDGSVMKYGLGQLRPAWEAPAKQYSPISTYKWTATERALNNLAKVDASPFDDVALEYVNPTTGGPVLPTIGCRAQLIRRGVRTVAHRHTTSAVYHVFEGRGYSVINGQRFNWERGDIFVVPEWAWHEHAGADGEAFLFSVHDTPILAPLGLYREEAYTKDGGHQEIKGVFEG